MSNFLAIAAVTATLQHFLQDVVNNANVRAAKATTTRPDGAAGGTLQVGVNIFLYQVKSNVALRNADLPSRREDGALTQRPRAALDLHYLLSFYGNEKELEPQRLLGAVARTLHAQPILTREMIRDTIKKLPFLADSDLDKQSEMVRLTLLPLSLEELSKLWSVFFQTPYALSVTYEASVVLIEGAETPRAALPVQERTLTVLPFRFLELERVESALGPHLPVLAGGKLILRGRQLRGDKTRVVVSGNELTPQNVSDEEISLELQPETLSLRAGMYSVYVSHKLMLGKPTEETEHRGFESNVAAFVLTPNITNITSGAGSFTIDVAPRVRLGQRVALLLNNVTTGEAHTFFLDPVVEESDSVTFSVSGLKAGKYFVRLQVDGAESSLLDLDPRSSTFKQLISPQVTIP